MTKIKNIVLYLAIMVFLTNFNSLFAFTISGNVRNTDLGSFVNQISNDFVQIYVFNHRNIQTPLNILHVAVKNNGDFSYTFHPSQRRDIKSLKIVYKNQSASISPFHKDEIVNFQQQELSTISQGGIKNFDRAIDQITTISYNQLILDFDQYSGSIVGFEDRIYIDSSGRLQEFQIFSNGELKPLSSMEAEVLALAPLLINESRLYSIYSKGFMMHDPPKFMMVHDLTTIPMTHISTIEMPYINSHRISNMSVWNEHIFLDSNMSSGLIYRFNMNTLLFDEPIITDEDFVLDWPKKDKYMFSLWWKDDFESIEARVYEMSIDEPFKLLKRFDTDMKSHHTSIHAKITDDKYIIMGWDRIEVYDISDINNISLIVAAETGEIQTIPYVDVILYNDIYLIAMYSDGIHIYDIYSDLENPQIIYDETAIDYYGLGLALFINDDKLYAAARHRIHIYDLKENFKRIFYGRSSDEVRFVGDYIINNQRFSDQIEIYSVLEADINIITIDVSYFDSEVYRIHDFTIIDNLIYAVACEQNGQERFNYNFDIYEINNGSTQLIKRIPLDFPATQIIILKNHILFGEFNLPFDLIHVYQLLDNEIIFYGQFTGNLSYYDGFTSEFYFLCYSPNWTIEFRDIEDPLVILNTAPNLLGYSGTPRLRHIGENTVSPISSPLEIYVFDEITNRFVRTYISNDWFNFYNGIGAAVNDNSETWLRFYEIENGIPRSIGQYEFEYVRPFIHMFPKEKKMILRSMSGFHLYDIDFTVSDIDVVAMPEKTVLLANFPNPFNPVTTIRFNVGDELIHPTSSQESAHVRIDIYNIRGQRIKTLVNSFMDKGEHSVLWNGLDENGHSVSSGVYFYAMKTDNYTETRKMLLLK